jgi:hypothetical protein
MNGEKYNYLAMAEILANSIRRALDDNGLQLDDLHNSDIQIHLVEPLLREFQVQGYDPQTLYRDAMDFLVQGQQPDEGSQDETD